MTVTGNIGPALIEAVHSQRRQNGPTHGSSYQRIIIGHRAMWLHSSAVHLRHSINAARLLAEVAHARQRHHLMAVAALVRFAPDAE